MRAWVRRNPHSLWALLAAALGVAMLWSASVGAVSLAPERILAIVLERTLGWAEAVNPPLSSSEVAIVMDVRLPRLVTAAVVGAALALAGVIFQGLLRNPLADPYIIGTAAGSALGATIALILSAHWALVWQGLTLVPLSAFGGAWGAVLIVYRLARVGARTPIVTLLLAGFAVSSILTASMAFLWLLNDVTLRRVILWTMGGLSATSGWAPLALVAPMVLAGSLAARLFTNDLNALLLGEEAAAQLGVEVERRKLTLLALGSLLTAAAVSISGLIGFVGLVIPHVARILLGPDHRTLLPAAALIGALFLVLADLLARTLLAPQEIPVGILTALCGAPFFIYLLRRGVRQFTY